MFTKIYNKLILLAIVIGLLVSNYFIFRQLQKANQKNTELAFNMESLANNFGEKFRTDSLENGKLLHKINALTINSRDLKRLNGNLTKRLKDLDLKIKNLESVSDIGMNYNFKIDTLKSVLVKALKDSLQPNGLKIKSYKFNKVEKFIDLSGEINLIKNKPPYITNFNLQSSDSLIISNKILFKRPWYYLWLIKKPIGMELNVNNVNKYNNFKYIKHYNFNKLKK